MLHDVGSVGMAEKRHSTWPNKYVQRGRIIGRRRLQLQQRFDLPADRFGLASIAGQRKIGALAVHDPQPAPTLGSQFANQPARAITEDDVGRLDMDRFDPPAMGGHSQFGQP